MKSLYFTFSFLANVVLNRRVGSAEDYYARFAALPELDKDRIVWKLHDRHEWGSPEQKPVCRDILANQGYSFANAIHWTTSAIDLAETQGWKDLSPLITKIF